MTVSQNNLLEASIFIAVQALHSHRSQEFPRLLEEAFPHGSAAKSIEGAEHTFSTQQAEYKQQSLTFTPTIVLSFYLKVCKCKHMEGDNSAENQGLLNKIVAYKKKAFFFPITPHLPVKHREYLTMICLF